MRAFEHDAHRSLRRTDLTVAEKRNLIGKLMTKYGFDKTPAAIEVDSHQHEL